MVADTTIVITQDYEPPLVYEICAQQAPWDADHDCRCVLSPGHMSVIPQCGHGCPCGAVWGNR